jgi:hypothetical protein
MFPRKPLAFRQSFAQVPLARNSGFAKRARLRDADLMQPVTASAVARSLACYPYSSLWSGPAWVRPLFSARAGGAGPRGLWQLAAYAPKTRKFRFAFQIQLLDSGLITTNQRGTSTCVKLSSFSPFSPCRSQVACKTRARAASLVRQPVLPWLTSPTTTPSPALSLAALLVRPAARCQARAATSRATDLAAASAARLPAASRGTPSAGRLHFYRPVLGPARQSKGREPCSKRS